jgi:hypothetical protein
MKPNSIIPYLDIMGNICCLINEAQEDYIEEDLTGFIKIEINSIHSIQEIGQITNEHDPYLDFSQISSESFSI